MPLGATWRSHVGRHFTTPDATGGAAPALPCWHSVGAPMSVHVSSAVWSMRGISSTEKMVLLKLADCANDEGQNAFPAVSTIADECGMDERTVQRTLTKLRMRNLIAVQQEHDRSAHRPTTYCIDLTVAASFRGGNLSPQDDDGGGTGSPGRVTSDPIWGGTVPPDPSGDPSDNHQERSLAPQPLSKQQEALANHLRRGVVDQIYGARTGAPAAPDYGEAEVLAGATAEDIDAAIRATLDAGKYGPRGAAYVLGCLRGRLEDRKEGRDVDTRGSGGGARRSGTDTRAAGRRGVRGGDRGGDASARTDPRYDYSKPVPRALTWDDEGV